MSTFLEADIIGMLIYKKMGFRQQSELLEVDLRLYKVETIFVITKITYSVPDNKIGLLKEFPED